MEKDLRITKLEFRNFRSYSHLDLKDIGGLTIFVGQNGVGKTNILEGIQLLSACTSFKHPTCEELILEGQDCAHIGIQCENPARLLDITLDVKEGKKTYRLNGKGKQASDLKGTLPAVMFTPDDLEIAKKSSSVKREAIDSLGGQLTPNYHVLERDYEKVVRYKNQLLRDEASKDLVLSINDTLVMCAAQLVAYRLALFRKIMSCIERIYDSISHGNEQFSAVYQPSWSDGECEDVFSLSRDQIKEMLIEQVDKEFPHEQLKKRSLVGPHADKIHFYLGGKDVSLYASQGQQRSVVLAFKLAEVQTIKDTLGQNPVLLLDDVMSELDQARRRALIDLVEKDIQTFITTTNLDYFDESLLSRAQVINLPLTPCETEVR